MKLSLNWLQRLIKVDMTPDALADALTMAGLEVEGVERPFAHLDAIKVGRIHDIQPHPNADKLRLCKVDTGDTVYNVVCGAPNIEEGMLAPLAPAGTVMPDGTKLKKGKIRGEASEGMLCSARELELADDHSGILALETDAAPGTSFTEAFGLADTVFEIGLTPNRVDCACVMGLARETAALEGKCLTRPAADLPEPAADKGNITDHATVEIQDPEGCPRYATRLVFDITVAPSPAWLKNLLTAAGLRPINNIVDITNYVMLETGQPLHAFDYDTLAGGKIIVRKAAEGEKFTTLDDKERTLADTMVMICDGEKPVAVAGVMGGQNSEVTASTRRVLIESACFDAPSVRKTARTLGLSTDASYRFERGVDPEGTLYALDRAAALMAALGNGALVDGLIDENPRPHTPLTLTVSAAWMNRRIGISLSPEKMADLLTAAEFTTVVAGDELTVTVPSFRVDVFRAEDISEEVARLFGYNNIQVTFPQMPAKTRPVLPIVTARRAIQDLMQGYGFREAINYSFVARESADQMLLPEEHPLRRTVDLLNPISEELSVMRTTLVPSMLGTIARNIAQQEKNLRFFETGATFRPVTDSELPEETEMLCFAMTGVREAASWRVKPAPCDFFDIKGVAEALLSDLRVPGVLFAPLADTEIPWARNGAAAKICVGETEIGRIYEVHPESCKGFEIKQSVFMGELLLAPIFALTAPIHGGREIPKYPATTRDVTLILDQEITAAAVLDQATTRKSDILESVRVHDLYEGDRIPEGKKSLTLRMVYRSASGTLADKKVNKQQDKLTASLLSAFNATLPA